MNRSFCLLFVLFSGAALAGDPLPLPEASKNTTGYSTVEAALSALRADPAVSEREQQGWLLFEDPAHFAFWSFPPKGHPAYPSAVKREIVKKDGGWSVIMSVQCGADKNACDQLVRQFQLLNEQMSQAIRDSKAK